MLKTLVTSPRITPDSKDLMVAAETIGQPTIRLSSFRPIESLRNQPISIYGESLFAIILSNALNHAIIEPQSDWLINLPLDYTKRVIYKQTIGEARQVTKPQFVKNADGLKGFDAKVYETGAALPNRDFYPDDYEVLVSEPVTWHVEYRCFVLQRELQTLSIYLQDGKLAKNEKGNWIKNPKEQNAAQAFCQRVLDDHMVAIPPACVIDVGIIHNEGWAVVEANPAFGAGIYGCDPQAVLATVNRATIPQTDITEQDTPWIITYDVDG